MGVTIMRRELLLIGCILVATPTSGRAQGDLIFSDGFESGDTSVWSRVEGGIWRPTPGTSWQWQLTGSIDTSIDVEMYDIDLFDVPGATISDLKGAGRAVICYFSAGSWEDWRPDAGDYPAVILGNPLDGWPGERWVDVRRLDLLGPILEARLDLARSKGCTGVEPDNSTNRNGKRAYCLGPFCRAPNCWPLLQGSSHRTSAIPARVPTQRVSPSILSAVTSSDGRPLFSVSLSQVSVDRS